MNKVDLPIGMMGESPEVIARFRKMVAEGESQRIAEILACRKAPSLETDTSHFSGMKPLEVTCGPEYAKKVKQQAREAGISISDSSIYNGSIADKRGGGDPNAWLLAGDGRAKWKKSIQAKGGSCESLGVEANGKSLEISDRKEHAIKKRENRRKEFEAMKKDKALKG